MLWLVFLLLLIEYILIVRPLIDMDGINPTEVKSKAKSTDMLDIIEIEKNNAIRNLHA